MHSHNHKPSILDDDAVPKQNYHEITVSDIKSVSEVMSAIEELVSTKRVSIDTVFMDLRDNGLCCASA